MSEPVDQDKDYRISPPPTEIQQGDTRTYRVVYEIDVEAASPLEAARQVEEIFHDPGTAPYFTILDSDGQRTDVDLMQEGLEDLWGKDEPDGETADPAAQPPKGQAHE